MAKGKAKGSQPKQLSQLDEYAMTDSDNEIEDGFATGADRIALEKKGAGGDSDDEIDEEAVYDLDDEDEDDDDEEEEEEDDEDILEQALQQGGRAAQLAKQARYLEQKLKLQRGEDDEDDGEDEGQAVAGLKEKLWGANKRAYYQTEDGAEESDEEALKDEEAEVKRLQAQQLAGLDDDDYGLPGAAGQRQQQQQEQTLGQLAGAGGVQIEAVTKDLGALTAEEQLAVVMADAPELLSLLEELKACLAEVRGRIGPLLREVTAGGLATSAGLSYLEAKHLLLLQYCMCIVAYLMLKAEGKSVKDHPVIGRLVQLRAYIEKIRPIDKQLAYQIDKLLRATSVAQAQATADAAGEDQEEAAAAAAAAAAAGDDDALRYRPNPQQLITKAPLVGDVAGLDAAAAGGVYKPPKLNPVAMDEDRALSNKEMRKLREAQRRAQRSSVMREMAAELVGAPEEVHTELPGMDGSAAAVAARQRLEARAAQEEELMLRVPLSKQEAKKLKAQRRAGLSGAAGLVDFADDVADLVNATSGEGKGGLAALYGKKQLSQQYGADLATQQAKMRSGDEDLLPRKPLHERRAAFDAVAARRAAAGADFGDDDDDEQFGGGKKRKQQLGEEDEFYAASKEARAAAKAAKKAKHAVPQLAPPLPEPEAAGQRKISYEIEKNRGLTPHRRKDLKNPRKKHRIKFAEAVVRRKGQVQGVKDAPSAPRGYAGEATGIKSKVAKSRRLG